MAKLNSLMRTIPGGDNVIICDYLNNYQEYFNSVTNDFFENGCVKSVFANIKNAPVYKLSAANGFIIIEICLDK